MSLAVRPRLFFLPCSRWRARQENSAPRAGARALPIPICGWTGYRSRYDDFSCFGRPRPGLRSLLGGVAAALLLTGGRVRRGWRTRRRRCDAAGSSRRCPSSRSLRSGARASARRTSRARSCSSTSGRPGAGPAICRPTFSRRSTPARRARRRVRGHLDRRGRRDGARLRRAGGRSPTRCWSIRRRSWAPPLEILALPTLVIMDARGQIAYRHTGVADAETIEAALRAAAASAAAATSARPAALAVAAEADPAWSSSPSSSSSHRRAGSAGRRCPPRARPRLSSVSPPPICGRCASSAGSVRAASG